MRATEQGQERLAETENGQPQAPELSRDATTGSRASCTCARCVSCCERKPGWFKPGEAERVAAFLKIPLAELFRDYLAVDWWEDSPNVYVLSPAIVGNDAGAEMPYDAGGRCVFLKQNRCTIHAVKPFECGVTWCADGPVDVEGSAHDLAQRAWRAPEHQAQIATLLGREPEASEGSFWESLILGFGR